jgi:hypothetical protein
MDAHVNTIFLKDHDNFIKQKNNTIELFKGLHKINTPKKRLETIENKFNYIKLFSHLGVQGLVGLLEIKKNKQQVVFKVSVEDDKCIENEYSTLETLNSIRSFCPHFVGSYHMIELPICRAYLIDNSREYSDEDESDDEEYSSDKEDQSQNDSYSSRNSNNDKMEDEHSSSQSHRSESVSDDPTRSRSSSKSSQGEENEINLFHYDDDLAYSHKNVLFLEYVSDMSLKHVMRYSDKNVLFSQIISVLCGLYMAQRHVQLTHYDLHIDNVMLKAVEPDALFVYHLGPESFVVPTHGLYPVIIDMGNSYCSKSVGEYMKTTPRWYKTGGCYAFYDRFNDIHHFLMNLFTEIEHDTDEYYYISTRLMWMFRRVPIYRESGWKNLPNNIFKNTRDYIRTNFPQLYEWKSYRNFDKMFMETLSLGIQVPWKQHLYEEIVNEYKSTTLEGQGPSSQSVINSTENYDEVVKFAVQTYYVEMCRYLEQIYKIDKGDFILYILKEIVDVVNTNSKQITKKMDKIVVKKLYNDLIKRVECSGIELPAMKVPDALNQEDTIDYGELFYSCKMCSNILSVLYFKEVIPNIEKINDCYSQMESSSAIDFIKFFKKNTANRYEYNRKTVLYVWDSVNKTSKRMMLNSLMKNTDIEKLNQLNPARSERKILQLLQQKK